MRDRGSGGVTFDAYTGIPGAEGFADALPRSLALAALTIVLVLLLMVPDVVLVDLRLPRLRPVVEVLTCCRWWCRRSRSSSGCAPCCAGRRTTS